MAAFSGGDALTQKLLEIENLGKGELLKVGFLEGRHTRMERPLLRWLRHRSSGK